MTGTTDLPSTSTRNVFVLNTGRCGSVTFIRACSHITNYTAAHESRKSLVGPSRFDYPPDHIEADNRLSWLLGRLDEKYGADAVYVHLYRRPDKVVSSYVKRYRIGLINAYRDAILWRVPPTVNPEEVAADFCDSVRSNISMFLKDKPYQIEVSLENIEEDFKRFWEYIGAEGSIDSALAEFETKYNATPEPPEPVPLHPLARLLLKIRNKVYLRTRIRRFLK